MKLDIGCGRNKRKGYIGCDTRSIKGVDYICKAYNLPFPDKSIQEIYSRHIIEHLTLKQFLKTLAEWNRVLKKGGRIYIICPNLLWHLDQIIKGEHQSFYIKDSGKNDRYWGYGSLFGWQSNEYDVHKFGYYFQLLRDMLKDAGFEKIKDMTGKKESLERASHHLEVVAYKKSGPYDYKNSLFYRHFNVKH